MTSEMKLARLSICPCGFPVLRDDIPLGTVYTVDTATIRKGFTYRCGQCGAIQEDVEVVYCSQSRRSGLAPLPLALFSQ